ncbi:hypothetical protein PGT21_037100 [Puccinia graminis f. sp. tritici]|uniref:Secreted protein n=1 Tax=Puccinia graminis f. sp. tritici TaxID=56615 RepID=A0A5B0R449_PUCGR|nr:hypothetical protein PGT21_037100 [Puccinia graminis f. sp. tritici]
MPSCLVLLVLGCVVSGGGVVPGGFLGLKPSPRWNTNHQHFSSSTTTSNISTLVLPPPDHRTLILGRQDSHRTHKTHTKKCPQSRVGQMGSSKFCQIRLGWTHPLG